MPGRSRASRLSPSGRAASLANFAGNDSPRKESARARRQAAEGFRIRGKGSNVAGRRQRRARRAVRHRLPAAPDAHEPRQDHARRRCSTSTTAPEYPLRGHQLGYRPKTNSYDAWDLAQWEQYIRDLAVFGTNAIELIPPRSDDDADSPHFPLPPMEMMVGMSRAGRRVRPGRLDLVSGHGPGLLRSRRRSSSR